MRKAFNFYNSYFQIGSELSDKDRLAFYDALITRQFTGVEIELTGMAKFAYISQKHSIDAQISGYESKTKVKLEPLQGGSVGGSIGGSIGGSVQEKEQEKVKEQEKGQQVKAKKEFLPPSIDEVIKYFDENNFSQIAARKAYEYYNIANWKDSTGKQVKNWKQKMISVWFKPENKKQTTTYNPNR